MSMSGLDGSVANMFCLLGYLVMLFVEKVAFSEAHATIHAVLDDGHSHDHKDGSSYEGVEHALPSEAPNQTPAIAEAMQQVAKEDLLPPHIETEVTVASPTPTSQYSQVQATDIPSAAFVTPTESESRPPSQGASNKTPLSSRSALVLLTAMSFHSFFEAMALGIASDTKSAILMATSIGLHQPAESMALLVAFLKTNMPNSSVMRWLGLFSIVAPIGMAAGIFVSSIASPWLEASIVAITAGTFLYVGATEVVNEEFEETHGTEKYLKFMSFVGGMASIYAISEVSEGIGGGHDHGGTDTNHHHHHHHHTAQDTAASSWSFFGSSSKASSLKNTSVQTSSDGSPLGAIPKT